MDTGTALGMRAVLSSAARYFHVSLENPEAALERVSERIGCKLSVLFGLRAGGYNLASAEGLGKAISKVILPRIGFPNAKYGISRNTGRLVVKIPRLWDTQRDDFALPIVPGIISRILDGWYFPVEVDVCQDRSILVVVSLKDLSAKEDMREYSSTPI